MRIVIDMQGAQAQSRQRGIGRYTLALVRGLVRQRGQYQLILLLNRRFEESCESLIKEFAPQLGRDNIKLWSSLKCVHQVDTGNQSRWQVAEALYENVLGALKPDMVLITSLFEGVGDDAVTSIKSWRNDYPVATILYDLIPLLHPSPYLDNPAHARWYHEKVRHLKQADVLLSISQATRQEGLEHLGLPESAITNISSAIDALFIPTEVSEERQQVLRAHYGIPNPFVMYTGGIDYRKNVEGLIRAFAKLPKSLQKSHQLAIVCAVHEPEKERLHALAKQYNLAENTLILTGYVPEQDLLELYNLCEVFVFPSWHEGFGLPALEAMSCGAPVIAANTTSLPEVVGWEEALFDPHSEQAIADKIARVLTDDDFRNTLMQHGLKQAKRFSWDATASVALSAISAYALNDKNTPCVEKTELTDKPTKPKLAFISPLPPERSGISDYSAELLPELAHYYDIDLIVEQVELASAVQQHGQQRDVAWLREHADEYDRVLYHFGNSSFHQHMFSLLEEVPGIVVLHDYFLSGIIAHREWFFGLPNSWAQALYESHGYHAVAERYHHADTAEIVWRYPCNLRVLQHAEGVIVHSPASARLAERWVSTEAVEHFAVIPLLRQPPKVQETREALRQRLDLPQDALVVASFGFIGPTKLNHRLVDAFLASTLAQDPRCYLLLVGDTGQDGYGQQLHQKIRQAGLGKRLRITGWNDDADYHRYLAAADIGVQLRTRSRGETSAAVLDCMNYGLATIANANGSMADLPDETVLKIADDFTDAELIHALESLQSNASQRETLSQAAKDRLRQEHNPQTCAKRYQQTIEAYYQQRLNRAETIAQTLQRSPAMTELSEADTCQLAACLDANFPEYPRQAVMHIDITDHLENSNVQPLAQALLAHWLQAPPRHYRVEPVYADAENNYRYARRYALTQLECDPNFLDDDPVSPRAGDLWLALELSEARRQQAASYTQLLEHGGVYVSKADTQQLDGTVESQAATLINLLAPQPNKPTLWVDISELALHDANTGIQRVVRNILAQWYEAAPNGYQLKTIVANASQPGYCHATQYTLAQQGLPATLLPNVPAQPQAGDCFIGLDLQPIVVASQRETYRSWRQRGVHTAFLVYDLLCIHHPEYFTEGGEQDFTLWLQTVSESHQLICISQSVSAQLHNWLEQHVGQEGTQLPRISWFHLGAELDYLPISATPQPSPLPAARQAAPTLLMVGTLEPRKGHQQALAAFEQLWQNGQDINLVIVGKPGWQTEKLCKQLHQHSELGKRLFWWHSCDDATLAALYQTSTALLAASYDEGFGLPLIEAARYGLAIIARDIPVFREVAGQHASYFQGATPELLAQALASWLVEYSANQHIGVEGVQWQTWQQSAAQLAICLPEARLK
jgi:glycosyltransferase involved in cell wall biosynthesis